METRFPVQTVKPIAAITWLLYLTFLLFPDIHFGQRNVVSHQEWNAILFNGKTLEQINATKGEEAKVKALFGSYERVERDYFSVGYYYPGFFLGMKQSKDWPKVASRMEFTSPQVYVRIKGKTIRVGDSVSKLADLFKPDDLIIVEPPPSKQFPENHYSVTIGDTDYFDALSFTISKSSHTITEFHYWVSP